MRRGPEGLKLYDRKGREISEQRCQELHSQWSYRCVREDSIRGDWRGKEDVVAAVVTLWTSGFDAPFLFETTSFVRCVGQGIRCLLDYPNMLFVTNDVVGIQLYETEERAIVGHAEMLALTQQWALDQKVLNGQMS